VSSSPIPVDLRILVVDDDPMMVSIIVAVLRDAGLSLIEAADGGAVALARLAAQPFDLLICDLNMPDMDGISLMRQVASFASPPAFLLLSGEDQRILNASRQYAEARKLTILGMLRKPVERESLTSMLEQFRPAEERTPRECGQPRLGSEQIRLGLTTGALHLAYQPKVDLRDGALIGVEALLRWHDPEFGSVPAPEVVRAAESAQMIDPLTIAVLARAVTDRASLLRGDIDINIAINVSMHNLRDLAIIDRMTGVVAAGHDRPDHFTLEVTETHLINDLAQVLEGLIRLRLQRFKIAIDDYGTGAATMQFLMQLPSTELKIDRSFVTAAPCSEHGRVLLRSAIELGLHLGQTVSVEGVETESEAQLVRELGSQLGQGYFYGRPMELDELIAWTSTHLSRGEAAGVFEAHGGT